MSQKQLAVLMNCQASVIQQYENGQAIPDHNIILKSVSKTGRLVIIDPSNPVCSISTEIISIVQDQLFDKLKSKIIRINYFTIFPFIKT